VTEENSNKISACKTCAYIGTLSGVLIEIGSRAVDWLDSSVSGLESCGGLL
jgi:hypothetical protein